jgi:hypothetical protein
MLNLKISTCREILMTSMKLVMHNYTLKPSTEIRDTKEPMPNSITMLENNNPVDRMSSATSKFLVFYNRGTFYEG